MARATGTASKTAGEKKSYKVLKNLRHDRRGYAPGAKVDLHDIHAAPLLRDKVVEPAAAEPGK